MSEASDGEKDDGLNKITKSVFCFVCKEDISESESEEVVRNDTRIAKYTEICKSCAVHIRCLDIEASGLDGGSELK